MSETLYKWLGEGGEPCHGGRDAWDLPRPDARYATGYRPSAWREAAPGPNEPCTATALHLCREQDLVHWISPELYTVEADGEIVKAGNKVCVKRARLLAPVTTWTETTARLFACDMAEWVLPLFERAYPRATRPREAIRVARAYARGEATLAAWAAARDAARAAARDAARDAAWAAASDAARAAARDAAWTAASDAAWAAAWTAAWTAATHRLLLYIERGEAAEAEPLPAAVGGSEVATPGGSAATKGGVREWGTSRTDWPDPMGWIRERLPTQAGP